MLFQKETIQERLTRIRNQRIQALKELKSSSPEEIKNESLEEIPSHLNSLLPSFEKEKEKKIPNAQQYKAIHLATEGKTFCLTGAAGTGKTFTTQELCNQLLSKPHSSFSFSTKYLIAGKPAIVLTGFTRRSVKNAKEAIDNDNITCINIHKLVEYNPVPYEIVNEETGQVTKSMRFEPSYNRLKKLPHIQTILIDETSQFSVQLFDVLLDALPNPEETQFIFIGDIHQIPPTTGKSIYLPKLISEPSIELTEVYRQALESPIIRFLTDIRKGKHVTRNQWKTYSRLPNGERNNKINFGTFPNKIDWEEALLQASLFLKSQYENNIYNPYEDMVLVPFNTKKFGSERLSKEISHFLDIKEQRTVYPIICGWMHKYFAIGDHVLFETEDYVIKEIKRNEKYMGKPPNPPSKYIDREGSVYDREKYNEEQSIKVLQDFSLESDIDSSESDIRRLTDEELEEFIRQKIGNGQEEKYNAASHKIILESLDDPSLPHKEISSTGDLMKCVLSYAITVHKAQGLQAERVYFFLHSSHSPLHYRELIYTAASRAKEYLTIICDPKILERGIKLQRIKGNTLQEKIDYLSSLSDSESESD